MSNITLSKSYTTKLSKFSVAELFSELQANAKQTLERFVRYAAVVGELAQRGIGVESLKVPNYDTLVMVANGKLLPEVAMTYQCCPVVINGMRRLSLSAQEKLMVDGTVDVVRNTPLGFKKVNVPLIGLSVIDLHRAFGDGEIVPVEVQLKRAEDLEAKAEAARPKAHVASDTSMTIVLLRTEADELQAAADKANMRVSDLIRMALFECGYLKHQPRTGKTRRV